MRKYRKVENESDLDSLGMRGSYEEIQVGECTIGIDTSSAVRDRDRQWRLRALVNVARAGAVGVDSFRTLVEAFRAARRVTKGIVECREYPDVAVGILREKGYVVLTPEEAGLARALSSAAERADYDAWDDAMANKVRNLNYNLEGKI